MFVKVGELGVDKIEAGGRDSYPSCGDREASVGIHPHAPPRKFPGDLITLPVGGL